MWTIWLFRRERNYSGKSEAEVKNIQEQYTSGLLTEVSDTTRLWISGPYSENMSLKDDGQVGLSNVVKMPMVSKLSKSRLIRFT